jgi:uncharacterized protein YdaU (DUF1376 family)
LPRGLITRVGEFGGRKGWRGFGFTLRAAIHEGRTRPMNYYPHHIGDYLRDTAHLTACEDGTYRRLLDVYYASEKPLPLETHWVCRLVRARSNEEIEAVSEILRQYFIKGPDGWRNKRADDEIRKNKIRIKAAKTNGKRGGRPSNPVGLQKKPSGLAKTSELHNPNESSQNQNQNQIKNKPTPPDGGSTVWDFGKSLLAEQGLSTQSAGALIGSWLREWPEAEVADALRSAAGKADIRGYVAAILKTKPKKGAELERKVAL